MRIYRFFFVLFISNFPYFSYADLPYCENVFNGVLSTTGGQVTLWGSSKVVGGVDLNSTNISGGGGNCYSSNGGAAYTCTANGTLSQVVSYTVPALPPIPSAAGAANGTLDRSSGNPALTVASSGNYSSMSLNGYGSVVSVTFDGRAAPIVVNIAGSVGFGGNVRVNILGDVTIVANGYSSYGSPEVIVSSGASLTLKSRGGIGFSNGLKLNMQGSSSSVNVYARNDFGLPNDTVMRGQVVAGGNIQLSGSSSIVGPVSAAGNISMSSSSSIRGDVMLGGRLGISGNARIDGNLWAGSVHMSSGSKITGVAAVSGSFDGHDSSIFTGALVADSVTLTGSAQAILSEGLDYTDFCRDDAVVEFDHLRLFHSGGGQAVSCMATEIRVLACANEDCAEVFPGPASFTLGSNKGGFTNHTVAIDESGQGRVFLSNPNGGLSTISSSVPLDCSFPGCSIDFKDSALFISSKDDSLEPIPAQIAGKPFDAFLHAISTNPDTKACEARVEGSKNVGFSFSCIEPSCVDGQEYSIDGQKYSIGGDPVLGDREVKFDENGVSDELEMMYTDAGKVKVKATLILPKEGDDPAVVLEGSAEFVSRPYGFCIKPLQEAPLENGIVDFDSLVRFKAGEPFPVSVTAVRWKENGEVYGSLVEPLAAENICGNGAIPNYHQPKPTKFLETPELILPAKPGGVEGTAGGSFKHDLIDQGAVNVDVTMSEVGFFRIKMDIPPAYLENTSMSHSISQSLPIGRIIPAWLDIGDSNLSQEPGCPAPSAFTYQGQPTRLSGGLKVKGFNRDNKETLNYRDEFWRVSADQVYGLYRSGSTLAKGEGSHVRSPDPDKPNAPLITLDSVNSQIQFSDYYIYPRQATPSATDAAFDLKWVIWDLHDDDGIHVRNLSDAQPTWGGETEGFLVDGLIQDSKFHLGQLRSENLIVPHGNIAQAPIVLERWNGTAWKARADNGCTILIPPPAADMPEQLSYPDSGVTEATLDESTWSQSMLEVTATEPSAPHGSVLLRHLLRSDGANATWLCQRSEVSASLGGVCSYREGGDAEIRSSITFGLYEGSKPLIFRREVYR